MIIRKIPPPYREGHERKIIIMIYPRSVKILEKRRYDVFVFETPECFFLVVENGIDGRFRKHLGYCFKKPFSTAVLDEIVIDERYSHGHKKCLYNASNSSALSSIVLTADSFGAFFSSREWSSIIPWSFAARSSTDPLLKRMPPLLSTNSLIPPMSDAITGVRDRKDSWITTGAFSQMQEGITMASKESKMFDAPGSWGFGTPSRNEIDALCSASF